jgi:chemotaxis protein MotB
MNNRHDDAVPAWQTIYCSLILIMLVLFVMLVSYSVTDKRKMTNVKGHFDRYSGNKGDLGRENYISSSVQNETIPVAWIKDAMDSLRQAGIKAGLEGAVAVERTPGGLKFKMHSDVLFPSGQAVIREKVYPYLDEMIKLAKEHELSLSIKGHTDNAPIHNDAFPSSHWELSAARAANVLRYCLEKGEIPAGRLSAAGFGPYRPLVPNDTSQGRMQNRRIEVVLFKART